MKDLLSRRPIGCPRTLFWMAGAALLVGGYIHLDLYRHGYRVIPMIGVLFALNAAASAIAGLAILFRQDLVVRAGAIAVAAGTLVAFGASHLPGGIFNFTEHGLQPAPQSLISLLAEGAAVAVLAVTFAWDLRRRLPVEAAPMPSGRVESTTGHGPGDHGLPEPTNYTA